MAVLLKNNLAVILLIVATLSIVVIFVREYYQEKKFRLLSFIILLLSCFSIWGSYYLQNIESSQTTKSLCEIIEQNNTSVSELQLIRTQNSNLKEQLVKSLVTINALNETITHMDQKRRIEYFDSLLSEIQFNINNLKRLSDKKDIFLDPQQNIASLFRFTTDVLSRVVAESLCSDHSIQKDLITLKNNYDISNRMLDNIHKQNDISARIADWERFFGNFDDHVMSEMELLCVRIEKYLRLLETDHIRRNAAERGRGDLTT